jgi:serine/threonine-protein kinase
MTRRDYVSEESIPGTVYRVIKPLASGGMGAVYEVEDTTVGKKYVLKTLLPTLGDRQDLARRMAEEARVLAKLAHPNIVEVITAGVTGDEMRLPYYVMERLNGLNLRSLLEKKGALPQDRVVHIAIDLLDALGHAHDNGVIHRDVKPENIFLHRAPNGTTVTKLLDFGIMRMLDHGKETAGRFVGTLRYAAPEQIRGEKLRPSCDVYAAGLVIYELLAGRGPFDDEPDVHKIAQATLTKEPPPLSTFVPVSDALAAIVMASLAKDPDARPKEAYAFAASLRELLRGKSLGTDDATAVNLLAQLAETRPPASSAADQAAGVGTVDELNTTSLEMAVPARAASPMLPTHTVRMAGEPRAPAAVPSSRSREDGKARRAGGKGALAIAFAGALAVVLGLGFVGWKMVARRGAVTSTGSGAVATAPATTTGAAPADAPASAPPKGEARPKEDATPTASSVASAAPTNASPRRAKRPAGAASAPAGINVGPGF